MIFNVCEKCGAALDPGEKCDCKEEFAQKESFIKTLQLCLINADVDLIELNLIDNETVEARFLGGGSRRIDIAADSKLAIVKDVANHIA